MTSIIHHSLADSKLLENHHEVFRWQWNATLALIGYIMAYPGSCGPMNALNAVHTSIQVFERLGESFALALLAKQTTEGLLARVYSLGQSGRIEEVEVSADTLPPPETSTAPVTSSLELPNRLIQAS